jgi:SOS-response transcriptional repressor LexA
VPVVNKVAAGLPSGFTDLDYPAGAADAYGVRPMGLDDADAFGAVVEGRSMEPEYREGDIVYFAPRLDVVDGCDCYVRLEPDHEATFKRVFFQEGPEVPEGPGEPGVPGGPDGSACPGRRRGVEQVQGLAWVRLQPLNPAFEARVVRREAVAGMFRAAWRMSRLVGPGL